MGTKNVFIPFAFVARFCLAVFAFSSPLAFANIWDGDRYIRVDSHSSGKEVFVKNPWFGQPMKNGQAISKTATLQPSYKNKPLPPVPVTLSATPDAVKAGVKNLLRGGLAGLAVTEGIGALFDAVDWVLDPNNHMPQKFVTEAPVDGYGSVPVVVRDGLPSKPDYRCSGNVPFNQWVQNVTNTHYNYPYGGNPPRSNILIYYDVVGAGGGYAMVTYNLGLPTQQIVRCKGYDNGEAQNNPEAENIFIDSGLSPVSSDDIYDAVDNHYNLHPDDISQLVAERTEGAFVKPNLVYIGDSPDGSVSLSQFPVSDVTNTETVTIPHPNSSTTEPMTINYSYDGKNLPVTVPPNTNNSSSFTMGIVKNSVTSLDFNGTNQPAKSITYNSNTEKYELAEPLSESDSPVLGYTVTTTENYIVNGDTVYNSSVTNEFTNDNEIVVKDSIFPPFCDWASVVCDFINWFTEPPEPPEDGDFESLRPRNLPIGSLELDILEADKNCPAPKELTIASLNTTLTFKYDQICSAVEAINPFFLIICYISAARIVLRA